MNAPCILKQRRVNKTKFRTLNADEIECRVAQITERGLQLLLYKNARVDMDILDERFGIFGWKREHSRDNANCTVSIWTDTINQWVSKEDTGTESNTEAEKGLASDSFKRACVNWGIGRELYTAPFIWVKAADCDIKEKNGRRSCYDRFKVVKIGYDEKRRISELIIRNDTKNRIVFEWYATAKPPAKQDQARPKNATQRDFRADMTEIMNAITGGDAKYIATGLHVWSDGAYTTIEQIPDTELAKYLGYAEEHYKKNHSGIPYAYDRKENR